MSLLEVDKEPFYLPPISSKRCDLLGLFLLFIFNGYNGWYGGGRSDKKNGSPQRRVFLL